MASIAKLIATDHLNAVTENRRSNRDSRCVPLRHRLNDQQFEDVYRIAEKHGIAIQPGKGTSPHPVICAYTDMANDAAMRRISGYNYKIAGPSANELYNAEEHHCCTITGDCKQDVRYTQLRSMLAMPRNKMPAAKVRKLEHLDRYVSGLHTPMVCTDGVQNCAYPAPFIWCPHMIYDVTPEQVAQAMAKSGAQTMYATFLCPELLEAGSNTGTDGEVSWRVEMPIRGAKLARATERIEEAFEGTFLQGYMDGGQKWVQMDGFSNDPDARVIMSMPGSIGYVHSWKTYQQWMTIPGIRCNGKVSLLIERERFGSVMLLKIDRVAHGGLLAYSPTTEREFVAIPDLGYLLHIGGYVPKLSGDKWHRFPKSLWDQSVRQYMSASATNRDYIQVYRTIAANITSFYIGDRQALGWDKQNYNDFTRPDVMRSVYFQMCLMAHESSDLIKLAKEIETEKREEIAKIRKGGVDFFTAVGNSIKDMFNAFTSPSAEAYEAWVMQKASKDELDKARREAKKRWGALQKFKAIDNVIVTNSAKRGRSFRAEIYRGQSVFTKAIIRSSNQALAVSEIKECTEPLRMSHIVFKAPNEVRTRDPREDLTVTSMMAEALREYTQHVMPPENAFARKKLAKAQAQNDIAGQRLYGAVVKAHEIIEKIEWDDQWEPLVTIVQGGPGCAKSTYVRQEYKKGDMLVVATKEAKDEMLRKFARDNSQEHPVVCTPHSAIAAASREQGGTVYLDEAFLQMKALGVAVAHEKRADKVVLVGDYRQISYVDRPIGEGDDDEVIEVNTKARWNDLVGRVPETVLRRNFRLPAPHVEALNRRYCYNMTAESTEVGECTTVIVNSMSDVARSPGWKTVTFRQKDKEILADRGHDVNTIHEYQGSTAAYVHLVLRGCDADRLVSDPGYIVVGTSRHTTALRTTVICDDGTTMVNAPGNLAIMLQLVDLTVQFSGAPLRPARPAVAVQYRLSGDRITDECKDIHRVDQALDAYYPPDPQRLREKTGAVLATRVGKPAVNVRIAPGKFKNGVTAPQTMLYSSLSNIRRGAHQGSANPTFALRTFIERNGAGRDIMTRAGAERAALPVFERIKELFFKKGEITPATSDELQQAFFVTLTNIQKRGKVKGYAEGDYMFPSIMQTTAFAKTQLKMKMPGKNARWDPWASDSYAKYMEALSTVTDDQLGEGFGAGVVADKAGQGVVAWQKFLNLAMAPWIGVMDTRLQEETYDWFYVANGKSEVDVLHDLERLHERHENGVAVKGDDKHAFSRRGKDFIAHATDQSKFDSKQGPFLLTVCDMMYAAVGMPQFIIDTTWKLRERHSVRSTDGSFLLEDVRFGRDSGERATLTGNIITTVGISAMCDGLKVVDGELVDINITSDSIAETEKITGMTIKHERTVNTAEFIGYVMLAEEGAVRFLPDIPKRLAKELSRMYKPDSDKLDHDTRTELLSMGNNGCQRWWGRLNEVALALTDFLAPIADEHDLTATIEANLRYYWPDLTVHQRPAAIAVMREMVAFLQALSNRANIGWFAHELDVNYNEKRVEYWTAQEAVVDEVYHFLTSEEETEFLGDVVNALRGECTWSENVSPLEEALEGPPKTFDRFMDQLGYEQDLERVSVIERYLRSDPLGESEPLRNFDGRIMPICHTTFRRLCRYPDGAVICPLSIYDDELKIVSKHPYNPMYNVERSFSEEDAAQAMPLLSSGGVTAARIIAVASANMRKNVKVFARESGRLVRTRVRGDDEEFEPTADNRECIIFDEKLNCWCKAKIAGGYKNGRMIMQSRAFARDPIERHPEWITISSTTRIRMTPPHPAPTERELRLVKRFQAIEPEYMPLVTLFTSTIESAGVRHAAPEPLRAIVRPEVVDVVEPPALEACAEVTKSDDELGDGAEADSGDAGEEPPYQRLSFDIDFGTEEPRGIRWRDGHRSGVNQCFYDAVNGATGINRWTLKHALAVVTPESAEVYASEVEMAPFTAVEDLISLGWFRVLAWHEGTERYFICGGVGPLVALRLTTKDGGAGHWQYGEYDTSPDPHAGLLREIMGVWEYEDRYDSQGLYRGFVSKRGGAAAKIEDCVAPIAGFLYRSDQNTMVHMIGEAPGYAAENLANAVGVSAVHAHSLPVEDGGLHWKQGLPTNVITHDADLLEMLPLPPAKLAVCDMQDARVAHAEKFLQVTARSTYHVFKVMNAFDPTVEFFARREGWSFVKPRRSNVRSGEVYAVDFPHPQAMSVAECRSRLLKAWTEDAVVELLPHPDNMLNPVRAPEWCLREVLNLGLPVHSDTEIAREITELMEMMMRGGCVPVKPITGLPPPEGKVSEQYHVVPGVTIVGPMGETWIESSAPDDTRHENPLVMNTNCNTVDGRDGEDEYEEGSDEEREEVVPGLLEPVREPLNAQCGCGRGPGCPLHNLGYCMGGDLRLEPGRGVVRMRGAMRGGRSPRGRGR